MNNNRINKISKIDVIWNYVATSLKIGSSIFLLPIILKKFSADFVAIWSVFSALATLTFLLDFGFNSSFVRTVGYIFSGCKELKKTGYIIAQENDEVDYSLLKSTISAMKWYYKRVALCLFGLLSIFGTLYLYYILKDYPSIKVEVYIAWSIFVINNTIMLYTLYYESLLQGRGYVKESKKIMVIAQVVYLIIAYVLVWIGLSLIALVSAQIVSICIIRFLSYKTFYDKDIKNNIKSAVISSSTNIIKTISPNATKMGLTSLGSFLISKSTVLIGSALLPLYLIASYGITTQIYTYIYSISSIYLGTYLPKILNARIKDNKTIIKSIIINAILISLIIYTVLTILICWIGPIALDYIGSQTQLLSSQQIIALSVFSWLETNHSMAGTVLTTKNYIPFLIPSIVTGIVSITLLFIGLKFMNLGVWALILAPGIAQLLYQNWKWPLEVYKDLKY